MLNKDLSSEREALAKRIQDLYRNLAANQKGIKEFAGGNNKPSGLTCGHKQRSVKYLLQ